MNVGVAHSEVNPNTRVMNSRGMWLTYALGVGLLHIVLLSIPFFSVQVAWTLTNVIHNLVSTLPWACRWAILKFNPGVSGLLIKDASVCVCGGLPMYFDSKCKLITHTLLEIKGLHERNRTLPFPLLSALCCLKHFFSPSLI